MTFRICFTFGLLTTIFDWYFPTIMIVILAILNDGAMISLSKDRVTPSKDPEAWFLKRIFFVAIFYGLYLTVSTIVLFILANQSNWFSSTFSLPNLDTRSNTLTSYCNELFTGANPTINADESVALFNSTVYGDVNPTVTNADQCFAENKWYRQSMLRALIYLQVSISGQALIFITRTAGFSFTDRPGFLLICAFVGAQIIASLFAGFGFNGYPNPAPLSVNPGLFLVGESRSVPIYGNESVYTASFLGCGAGYVLVAWIWSLVWYIPLDFIKFVLEGFLSGGIVRYFKINVLGQSPLNTNYDVTVANGRISRASRAEMGTARASARSGRARASMVVRGSVA